MQTHPALVIFDVDGTLLEAHTVTVPAIHETLSAFGIEPPSEERIRATFGLPVEEYEAWLAAQCPVDVADAVVAETNRRELECIARTGRLYPGVHAMLAALRHRGHRLATCSNASTAYLDAVLDAHDLRRYFDYVRCIGQGFADKAAMTRDLMARCDARPAIVVGDRAGDIAGARANNAFALGVTYGYGSPEEIADADACAATAAELPEAIERLIAAAATGCA